MENLAKHKKDIINLAKQLRDKIKETLPGHDACGCTVLQIACEDQKELANLANALGTYLKHHEMPPVGK